MPRILYLDIETSPILAAVWQLYDASAVWVERPTFILCCSYQWEDSKEVKTLSLPNYLLYSQDKCSDRDLVADLWKLLNEADVVIAHNGDAFDIKKINSRLLTHKQPPYSPIKTIDTLKLVRKTFKFDSSKLDRVAQQLRVGRKLVHTGADLWKRCIDGDLRAWEIMTRYCERDVKILRKVYKELRAWNPNPIDLNVYDSDGTCPVCKSDKVRRDGIRVSKTRRYQQFRCNNCLHFFKGSLAA